jgi:hypothetical protein
MNYILDNFTILVSLFSQPKGEKASAFFDSLKRQSFNVYKTQLINYFAKDNKHLKTINDNYKNVFNPQFYYIFGDFDLAAITIIDDYKYATRNLNPSICKPENSESKFITRYKAITGFHLYRQDEKPIIDFSKTSFLNKNFNKRNPFVSITNFKINNGFLLGCGEKLLETIKNIIIEFIEKNYPDYKYVFIDAFSWYEISLIIFSDRIDKLGEVVSKIREFKADEIIDYYQNCFYWDLLNFGDLENEEKEKQLQLCHLFANSHSYFGINQAVFDEIIKDSDNYTDLMQASKKLHTDIEWEIKPGHLNQFVKSCNEQSLQDIFNTSDISFLNGKFDYSIKEMDDTKIFNNIRIIDNMANQKSGITNNIRNVKTRLKFKTEIEQPVDKNLYKNPDCCNEDDPTSIKNFLTELSYSEKDLKTLKENLFICKSGHYLHDKILNAYSNYNEGIENLILFPYFIDFKGYLDYLSRLIETNAEQCKETFSEKTYNSDDNLKSKDIWGSEFRKKLLYPIIDFHCGYLNRIIQGYDLEDITDFNINYKGGIHQIISSYDLLYKIIGRSLLNIDEHKSFLSIGGSEIKSTINSIQSNAIHLFNPSIFLSTVTKEISNYAFENRRFNFENGEYEEYEKDQLEFLRQIDELTNELYPRFQQKFKKLKFKKYLKILFEDRLRYFECDLISLVYTFNFNLKLFLKWQWINELQNPASYDLQGNINEAVFIRISFRQLFLMRYFNKEREFLNDIKEISELDHLREKHFPYLKLIVQALFVEDSFVKYYNRLLNTYISGFCRLDLVTFPYNLKGSKRIKDRQYKIDKTATIYNIFKLTGSMDIQSFEQVDYTKKINEFGTRGDLEEIFLFVENVSAQMKNNFKICDPIYYDEIKHITPSLFIKSLIYSFLKYICEEINFNRICTLKRNMAEGKIRSGYINRDIDILIDPAGGFFTTTEAGRKMLFKTNQILLKSIWDLATRLKKDFLLSYKNELI